MGNALIRLVFNISNIANVYLVYNAIRVSCSTTGSDGVYTVLSGIDVTGAYDFISLLPGVTTYTAYDTNGDPSYFYKAQYFYTADGSGVTISGAVSNWSIPILGQVDEIFYNPMFPAETTYDTSDQNIINKIRLFIGDPIGLRREYGIEALPSVHADHRTYEMSERGWPTSVIIGNVDFNTRSNPFVHGYKYLKFQQPITEITTISGIDYGIDIWYYTFRHSDKELYNYYNTCFPPTGLTAANTPIEGYAYQTAIDILTSELFYDASADGVQINDDKTVYNPTPGLEAKRKTINNLRNSLDQLVKTIVLSNIAGVLLD